MRSANKPCSLPLHDVGHGPFSHLLEETLNDDRGQPFFQHEQMTTRLMAEPDSPICVCLTEYRPGLADALVPFVDKAKRESARWYYEIVSSQLDADRLDYLARDGYMAGVQSHHFDSGRLISFLTVQGDRLAVDIRARDVLENYLLALDQMYQAVYYHHTVRAVSCLLSAILRRAMHVARDSSRHEELFPSWRDRSDPLWQLMCDGTAIHLDQYSRLDEAHVWSLMRRWRDADDTVLADLCSRLAARKFPKAVDIPESSFTDTTRLLDRIRELWHRTSPGLDHQYYVIMDEPDRVGYKRYKAGGEGPASCIMVVDRDGKTRPIEELARTITEVISKKSVAKRLVVPPEISGEVKRMIA